jgi:hypothetical protein
LAAAFDAARALAVELDGVLLRLVRETAAEVDAAPPVLGAAVAAGAVNRDQAG